jgi:hypothetical protein
MVALLLTAVAIMPVFGAATGTVTLSKTFVSPTGEATITVDDADLNSLTSATQAIDVAFGALGVQAITLTLDAGNGDNISGTPTIGTPTAGGQVASNYSLSVFNSATGAITIQAFSASTGNAEFVVSYKLAKVGTTTAKVTSPSFPTGITVTLTESGADTGVFEGTFGVDSLASNDVTDKILAVAGQVVTVKYTDADPAGTRQDTLTVENTEPAGVLVSPANKSFTTSKSPKLTVDFTDNDSEVDAGTIAFVIPVKMNSALTTITSDLSTVTTTAITNGFRAVVTIDASVPVDAKQTAVIRWYAKATDKAGNVGRTDADGSTSGNQDFTLFLDATGPDFTNAVTASAGVWWNAAKSEVEDDVTKSVNTSIGIKLADILDLPALDLTNAPAGSETDLAYSATANDKAEGLNASTVTAADFEVDGLKGLDGVTSNDLTPSAATVYAGAPNWIFLTVPAMAPDATPTVLLKDGTGGISDTAGNATTSGTKATLDAQAPTATAVLNRDLDDNDATLTITTNEVSGVPTVSYINAGVSASLATATVSLVSTGVYEAKIAPATDGIQSIKVTVADGQSNLTVLGSTATPASDFPKSGTIALYIDSAVPAPTVNVNNTAASGATVETSNPFFVTAIFTGEGKEYGLDTSGELTIVSTEVLAGTDLDIHNTVTIATATLDDVSILGLVDTQDNITFNMAVLDIATGAHELVIVGKDTAGNEVSTGTLKFTVTARKAYKVGVSAGWNLVSFPGDPADGDINAVLPAAHPATDVLSFNDGVWSVASRAAGGAWEGTLTSIDGKHGYWINTTSSEPVEALLSLPSIGSAATLPTIAIEAGWNLVSVIDLAQESSASVLGSAYFTSIDWAVAYTYSSSTRAWTRVTPSGATVSNGQGVWVWANKAGTLIP